MQIDDAENNSHCFNTNEGRKWITIKKVHGLYSERLIKYLINVCGFADTGYTKEVCTRECHDTYYNQHRDHKLIQRPDGMSRRTGEQVIYTVMSALRFKDLEMSDTAIHLFDTARSLTFDRPSS